MVIARVPPTFYIEGMTNHDFDFLFGTWKVRNRRLREPLAGSAEWVEFDATIAAQRVWGGAANMDEFVADDSPWGPIYGMTLRLFDPASQQWTIYWANRKSGRLDVPMTGAFKDGVGEFYDQEMFHGRMIYVRFLWTNETPDTARWQQAFSEDGGKNWETNWIMDLTRVAA
jgi:hypothetical protein